MKTFCFLMSVVFTVSNAAFAAGTTTLPPFSPTNRISGIEVRIVDEARDKSIINAMVSDKYLLKVVCDAKAKAALNFSVTEFGTEAGIVEYRSDAPDNNPKGFEEWLALADRLQTRFANVAGKFIVDQRPWKYVGIAGTLRSSELSEVYILEGDGEYKVIDTNLWVGTPPKAGDIMIVATDGEYFFSVEKKEGGKILIDAEVASELQLKERERFEYTRRIIPVPRLTP